MRFLNNLVTVSLTASLAIAADWNYSQQGADWADVCTSGTRQSPVAIMLDEVVEAEDAPHSFEYKFSDDMSDFLIENNGHSLQVNVEGSGHKLRYDNQEFTLLQFHFHAPAEHIIEKEQRGLEMHAVHSTGGDDPQNAVVGFFWSAVAGAVPDAFLQKIIDAGMPESGSSVSHSCEATEIPCLNIEHLFPSETMGQYVKYDGSLTTPPCTESVTWFVDLSLRSATQEQIDWFATHFHFEGSEGNFRVVEEGKNTDLVLQQLSVTYASSAAALAAASFLALGIAFFSVLVDVRT